MDNDKWLPHLKDSVPKEAFGYTVSWYSIALEGWRRGLTLKFRNVFNKTKKRYEIQYTLSSQNKEHKFNITRGDLVPKEAVTICVNKELTKEYLDKAGVPVPKGEIFGEHHKDEEIVAYAKQLGFPLVIKPSNGTGGNGVIANIKTEEEFIEALQYVKYDLKFTSIIVETFAPGEDWRVYVVGDKVIGAFKRIPANVIGDGRHTIAELLKIKNEERNKIPALYKRPIKIDKEVHTVLKSKGYTLNSIPSDGERVFLKTKNNVSSGGDPVDVTDMLTDEIKKIAVEASKAIPGLVQCGVDMMVDSNQNGVVIEVNSRPHIRSHLYPMEGLARDIPKEIIDYYFPETARERFKSDILFYFDLKSIKDFFKTGISNELTIRNLPIGNIKATRILITGLSLNGKFEDWVERQAKKLQLHGYVKQLKNGDLSVVISGGLSSINEFKELIEDHYSDKIKKMQEKNWEKPIKIGFEVKRTTKTDRLNNLKREVEKLEHKNVELKKEKEFYKKKFKAIENSTIWKTTKPGRKFMLYLKRVVGSKT